MSEVSGGEADARHLTWDNFRREFLEPGVPAVVRIRGTPPVDVVADVGGARLGVRVPSSTPPSASPFAAVEMRWVADGGTHLIEITTNEALLFREFYHFAISLADAVQIEGVVPHTAVTTQIQRWRALFREALRLTEEQELGLLGELWFLETLARGLGSEEGVRSWVGPRGEPHDFRYGEREYEVKVSAAPTRRHMINGLSQLAPSPDHNLHIISLHLAPAGASIGRSLGKQVERLRKLLGPALEDELLRQVNVCGYRPEDAPLYASEWIERTAPRLITVGPGTPRILADHLAEAGVPVHRILDVHYRVNLDGLGADARSPEGQTFLPATDPLAW